MTLLVATRRRSITIPYAMPTMAPWNVPMPAITPTPDGTGSAVHPSVLDFGLSRWRGYRFWMAMTPYYKNSVIQENPCILVSNNGYDWKEPTGGLNPIYPYPGTSWNSDTDLEYDPDTDELVLIYRGANFVPKVARSGDGVTWPAAPTEFTWPTVTQEQVSPALLRESDGSWVAWTVQHPTRLLHRWTASSPEGPWSGPIATTGGFVGNSNIWHLDVVKVAGTFYMVMSEGWTTGNVYAATSEDGIAWVRSSGPILSPTGGGAWDGAELYRSTITAHENGVDFRVWYSGRSSSASWRIGYSQIPRSLWPAP